MSKYVEKAIELHEKGYNCAQAVLCAFDDKTGIEHDVLYRLAEGFGSGMGNKKNTCGALSGAVILAGLKSSSGDCNNPTKKDTYKLVSKIADIFEAKCLTFNCRDIKGIDTGNPTISCGECIKTAVEAVSSVLFAEQ
jgi:C_GCAxxG_C_C family probable redox protein